MIALLVAEVNKLRGSLALSVAMLAPALPGLIAALALVSSSRTPGWTDVFGAFTIPIWAMFLMPMTVAAFTTLIAQIEHRAHGWDHLLALPIVRWQLFAAKLVVALAAVIAMTLVMLVSTYIGASIGGAIGGHLPTGAIPWRRLSNVVPTLLACSALITVIQLWTALRFASFVVPLGVGIAGTLVALAVAITGTDKADWFPWVLPLRALTTTDHLRFASLVGASALCLAGFAVAHLAKRRFR